MENCKTCEQYAKLLSMCRCGDPVGIEMDTQKKKWGEQWSAWRIQDLERREKKLHMMITILCASTLLGVIF